MIGKEFPLTSCAQWSATPSDELARMLDDLQLGEFIYEQPAVGESSTPSSTR